MKAIQLPLILLLILCTGVAFGQAKTRGPKDTKIYLPKAILVQLRSEKRKIDYLENVGKHSEAEQVRKDVQAVNSAMISDFRDNFKFCPYYFFVDTNIEQVKAKRFEGVLLNGEMKPAATLVVNGSSKDYFIVYYGVAERENVNKSDMAGRSMHGEGLVVTDYDYIQLDKPALFYYYSNRGYYQLHGKNTQYNYSSKKYNIEYYALAGEMSADFQDFFRKSK